MNKIPCWLKDDSVKFNKRNALFIQFITHSFSSIPVAAAIIEIEKTGEIKVVPAEDIIFRLPE